MKRRSQDPELQADLFSYASTRTAPTLEEKPAPAAPAAVARRPDPVPLAPEPEPVGARELEPREAPEPAVSTTFASSPQTVSGRTSKQIVVSIHDVSPLTREATERILGELAAIGITRLSLLVVPDHHCKGHFLDHPDFCDWLRARASEGHEIVVHGYYHRRDQRSGETFKEKLTTRYYTAGEGEFYDIAGADALRIISQARQEFRKIGLNPQGFVAPAWLLSDGADRALQRLGVGYTTRIGGVFDYTTGIQHHSQSLVWSTRSWWRRLLSLLWNPYLFRRMQPSPLLRIGIHPPDIAYRSVWRQIKALTGKALENRTPTTYSGYLKMR